MGQSARPILARAASALALAAVVAFPLQGSRTIENPAADAESAVAVAADYQASVLAPEAVEDALRVDMPLPAVFADIEANVSFTPPAGWLRGPATALNPISDPPEPVLELVRYQMRLSDPKLYAAPIPITSGLVADAGAVISVGLARVDSGLVRADKEKVRGQREKVAAAGFTTLDDEAVYEGVHIWTRYFFSREGERVVVIRAAAAESEWSALEGKIMRTVASLRADPLGANAPAAPPPPAPPAPVLEPAPDATMQIRQRILTRAASLLGLRYVWGGNSTNSGMDCSAYVSWTWSVGRFTTDSIWQVSFPIAKNDLRPGDAMNLTIGRDPQRTGHIRIFEAWANPEHTLVWVYEETPPRVVHRVIVYDERYQPIRLSGLSSAGETSVIPGLPAPTATRRPAATARPTVRPTARPTVRPTVRPSATPASTVRVLSTPVGTATPVRTATPVPTRTPQPTPTPIPRI